MTLRESNPKAYDAAMAALCAGLMGQEGANYKGQLAILLYPAVQKIVGEGNAAQVTGELVELPLEQVIGVMRYEGQLQACVDQAFNKGKGAAAESESEAESVATADESAAAAEPEQVAPLQNWEGMFKAIADPASKPARIVSPTRDVEEEKKSVRARTSKPSKPARKQPAKQPAQKPEFEHETLEWPKGMQKEAFLRSQGVHFNAEDIYYNCIHCQVELNFTSDPEKALVHCNRVGHQQNRAHNLSRKKGYRGRRQ